MSASPGDPSGPLAILPSYQATSEGTEDSVWRLLARQCADTGGQPGDELRGSGSERDTQAAPRRDEGGLAPAAIAAFLNHALMPNESLFEGVRRVAPPLPCVHRIHQPRDDGGLSTSETHRHAPPVLHRAHVHDDEELARTLLSACSDAVAERLREGARDVSLSGGVDSAVLCMLAARLAPGRIRAWSMDVHFADETERRNARTVARLAGVEHVDMPIPDALLPELFEAAVLANESPILNARAIASFAFYAEARRHGASVMLSGAGADEVLMGNPGALAAAMARIEEDRRLVQTVLRPAVDNLRMGNARASSPGTSDTEGRRLAHAAVDNLRMGNSQASAPGTADAEADRQLAHAAVDNLRMGNERASSPGTADAEADRQLAHAAVDNLRMGSARASAPADADRQLAHAAVDKSRMISPRAAPPGREEDQRHFGSEDESQKVSPHVSSPAPARAQEDGRHKGTSLHDAVDNLRAGHPGAPISATTHVADAFAVDNLGRAPTPWSLSDTSASEEVRYAAWVLRELVLPPELRGAHAHGITVHTPYLDTRCADVALALPESSLQRAGVGKWLFRHAVRGLVPDEVRLARKTPRYGHTALSSPVRARWLELYREWLSPTRMEPLGVILPEAPLSLLERYTRLEPDAPEASVVDRLLMRLCSLAMLHTHAVRLRSCPES